MHNQIAFSVAHVLIDEKNITFPLKNTGLRKGIVKFFLQETFILKLLTNL